MRELRFFFCAGVLSCIGAAACVGDAPAASESTDGGADSDAAFGGDSGTSDGGNPGDGPVGVTACAGNAIATVYFPPVAGASSYNLYYRTASESDPSTKIETNVTSPAKTPALVNDAQTFVSISAVVGGVETAHSAEVAVSPYAFTTPHDVLFAAGYSGNAVYAWDSYSTVSVGANPTRTVSGVATGISSPLSGSMVVDPSISQLYLSSSGSNSIGVWHDVATITSSAAPHHVLTGPSTQLAQPAAIAVDRTRNLLYVANHATPQILVWNDACNVHDDAAPAAILTANATNMLGLGPNQFFIDEANDRLFVAAQTTYDRFDSPSTWSGDASAMTPGWILTPQADAGTATGCDGITIDGTHDTIYFGNRDWGPQGAVVAATLSTATTGTIDPTRIYLNMTSLGYLGHVINVHVDSADRLFVSRDTGVTPARIERWNNASVLNGIVTAPDHYVELASGSMSAFAFLP